MLNFEDDTYKIEYNTEYLENLKNQLIGDEYQGFRRIHRVISWLRCANQCYQDDDQFYIFSWIAFNAMYGAMDTDASTERDLYKIFFKNIVVCDSDARICNTLCNNLKPNIMKFIKNKWVYAPFWNNEQGIEGYENWQDGFRKSKKDTQSALLGNRSPNFILFVIFDRMYVLRNQIFHGASTYQSKLNRETIKIGRQLLQTLIPIFIEIMLTNEDENWGEISYKPTNLN